VPLPYGGATRRPALEYKMTPVDDDSGVGVNKLRLIPFTFSVDQTYLLAFGNTQINIYSDTTLKNTVVTPYGWGDLNDIKYVQSADVMWFVHPDHPVQRLQRNADTDWSIAEEAFDFPPLLDENTDEVYFDLDFSGSGISAWSKQDYDSGDQVLEDGVVWRAAETHSTADYTGEAVTTFAGAWDMGVWVPDNKGATAELTAYDAKSGVSTTPAFSADSVGEYIQIKNNRNGTLTTRAGGFWNFITPDRYEDFHHVQSEFSTSYFQTGMSGGVGYNFIEKPINVGSANWSFDITGQWSGNIIVQRSTDNCVTWEDYVFIGNQTSIINKSLTFSSDEEEPANSWIRFWFDEFDFTGTVEINLGVDDTSEIIGLARITAFNSTSSVDVEILVPVQHELSVGISSGYGGTSSTRSKAWSYGAFSDNSGYPCCVALFENRLCYAGTSSNPDRLWLSRTDDYTDFQFSDVDTGAIDLTLNSGQIDEINWMVPAERLVIGTAGSEWSLGASDERKAITPTGFDLKRKTTYGSNDVQGLLVNSAVLFLMRQSRKVREWTPNYNLQDFVAPDLAILAEHITDGGVVQWDYQQQPDNILWSIRTDGTLLGFTYERDQNVTGWHRHANTAFTFESLAILPRANDEDEIWVSVNLGGTRVVAKMNDREWGTDYTSEWAGSDLYVDYQSAGDALHLAGKTVTLVVDGVPQGTQVVDGSGNITGATGTVNIVGLPFTSTLAPMYFLIDSQTGTTKGTKADNRHAVIRYKDTYSAKAGQSLDDLGTVKFDGDATALYSEDAETWYNNSSDFLLTCYVVQDEPMPCTVLCGIFNVEGR